MPQTSTHVMPQYLQLNIVDGIVDAPEQRSQLLFQYSFDLIPTLYIKCFISELLCFSYPKKDNNVEGFWAIQIKMRSVDDTIILRSRDFKCISKVVDELKSRLRRYRTGWGNQTVSDGRTTPVVGKGEPFGRQRSDGAARWIRSRKFIVAIGGKTRF